MARQSKLSDLLYSDLSERMKRGEFAPSSKLPSESELSAHFKVSRPIVREALHRLRTEGFIYSQQGAGSFVAATAAPVPVPQPQPLPSTPLIGSIADVRRMYDFRRALEGEIAHAAALNRTESLLSTLRERLEAITSALHSGQTGVEEDAELHAAIAASTQNQFFIAALASVRPNLAFIIDMTRSFPALQSKEHMGRVSDEHAAIVERIAARDAPGARQAMQAHIENAQDRLFNGLVPAPRYAFSEEAVAS